VVAKMVDISIAFGMVVVNAGKTIVIHLDMIPVIFQRSIDVRI